MNTWGFVLYNSLLSLALAPIFWFATGEYMSVFTAVAGSRGEGWFQMDAVVAVALSCVFGLLISFFGFAARKAVSATAFTVNKFLTVAINVMIRDEHVWFGLLALHYRRWSTPSAICHNKRRHCSTECAAISGT
jgi:hypothetical protein